MQSLRLRTKLDTYYQEVQGIIVSRQHPVTGLLPASTAVNTHGDYRDAWVRDNVYSILAVWGLALAYRALDDDGGRGFELERRTVKLMRGLLRSMMQQAQKVERFKLTRHPQDALHAKYDTESGNVAVGDLEWGHLQIDATSIYLLMLAQMISSGLDLIWTEDEVNFIQNLTYYIERAYRTPDFGIWERGAKSNQGDVELNSSSIGMAMAALEALAGFNLFGARGSQSSVVHVSPDNIAQANLTLTSMLPRESHTKEIDAALLSIVGYPGLVVHDETLRDKVRSQIVKKLEGRYGLKRFLRDGHQTELEDEGRLYYEPAELKRFEHIESEWPLFYTYLYLDAIFRGDDAAITHYEGALKSVLVEQNGFELLPELYYVPENAIAAEKANPGSQERVPNDNVPLVWAQSLYLLAKMMRDGVLRPGDIDPLGRRHHKLPRKPVVQLVFLAEDAALQAELKSHGVHTETLDDIAPIKAYLPQDIAAAHGEVGRNDRLGLTGRAARALKSLTTSRVYKLRDETVVCLASFFVQQEFFLAYDLEFLLSRFKSELVYLHLNWAQAGRPTVTVLLTRNLLEVEHNAFYAFMKKVEAGKVGSVPVRQARLVELLPTAAVERVNDLHDLVIPQFPIEDLLFKARALAAPGAQEPLAGGDELAIEIADDPKPLLQRLATSSNLYEEIELLAALCKLESLDSRVNVRQQELTLRELVEEVYEQAGRLRLWAVVRRAAGLLGKVDGDLSLAVGAILVRQKNIQVGRAYSDESLISHPIPEHELLDRINRFCRDDVRDRVLTQELLLYLSLLIRAKPELFRELLTIRVGQLITLLASEIAREDSLTASEGYERLMHLAPSEVQARLKHVIAQWGDIEDLPQRLEHLDAEASGSTLDWSPDLDLEAPSSPVGGWLIWRQHHGIIDRRPPNFYADVWNIFKHTPALVIGDHLERRNRMDASVVLSDMTAGERAFALWLEHLLNKIQSPEYRQLNIEALGALSSFLGQNPSLTINGELALDALLGHAVRLVYLQRQPEHEATYNDHKAQAWEGFYSSAPAVTSAAVVSALKDLLTLRAA